MFSRFLFDSVTAPGGTEVRKSETEATPVKSNVSFKIFIKRANQLLLRECLSNYTYIKQLYFVFF